MKSPAVTGLIVAAAVVVAIVAFAATRNHSSNATPSNPVTSTTSSSPATSTTSPSTSTTSPSASPTSSPTAPMSITVTYGSNGFSPATSTVKSGGTITFVNQTSATIQVDSNPHPAHTDDPDLNVGLIAAGQSKTVTVTKTGTFGFHNHLDPSNTAQVTIQ